MANGPEITHLGPGIHINELQLIKYATTVSGRPPAERLTDPVLLKLLALRDIPMGDSKSPYGGSRRGSKMKAHSLDTLRGGEMQQLMDSFVWLHEKFFTFSDVPEEQLTNNQFWRLCMIGEAMPTFLMLQAVNPISRKAVPEVVGNVFKAAIGFRNVARKYLDHDRIRTYDSPQELYRIADANRLFRQGDVPTGFYTCAAPETLITRSADALLFGKGGDPKRSTLQEYFPTRFEFGLLVAFSQRYTSYEDGLVALDHNRLSPESLCTGLGGIQREMNLSLLRDPDSIDPPALEEVNKLALNPATHRREFITPAGGPVHTAIAEILAEGAEIFRRRQALAKEGVVFERRTVGKKKRKK